MKSIWNLRRRRGLFTYLPAGTTSECANAITMPLGLFQSRRGTSSRWNSSRRAASIRHLNNLQAVVVYAWRQVDVCPAHQAIGSERAIVDAVMHAAEFPDQLHQVRVQAHQHLRFRQRSFARIEFVR